MQQRREHKSYGRAKRARRAAAAVRTRVQGRRTFLLLSRLWQRSHVCALLQLLPQEQASRAPLQDDDVKWRRLLRLWRRGGVEKVSQL